MASRRWMNVIGAVSLVLASTLLALAAAEGMLRLALFSDAFAVPALRQAWRYADEGLDDDYWKLAFLFGAGQRAQRVGRIDPQLGWLPEAGEGNELGIVTEHPYRVEEVRREPVLFYGDSFVHGASPVAERIPQQMALLLPGRPVLNYGVGGYGVDQIYLRFAATVQGFERPLVLIGILTHDLDRSVLDIRTGQKPRFDLVEDRLVPRNLPILPSTRDWIAEHPPEISSYLQRFVLFRLRDRIPEPLFDRWLGYDTQKARRETVNRAILTALRAEGERRGVQPHIVLFYSEPELMATGWAEEFLKRETAALGLPVFDTKPLLIAHMARTGETLADLYYPDNGHPNGRGNAVIARGLVDWLAARGMADTRAEVP